MLEELRDMAKKFDLEEDVIFLGFVEEEKKALYYKSANIFSLPSTNMAESFGIVNLEAMASGIPLVGSNLGGIPDIIHEGKNGLLAKPSDHKSLANAILKLLKDDDLRQKMGNNGKKMVADYSWDKIAKSTEDLYKDVLDYW
jgi:glycosyltransferase involved in cell wall biosynthesis